MAISHCPRDQHGRDSLVLLKGQLASKAAFLNAHLISDPLELQHYGVQTESFQRLLMCPLEFFIPSDPYHTYLHSGGEENRPTL